MEEPNRCCPHSTFALYQKHNEFGNPLFFLASSKQACCSLGRRHYLILQDGGALAAKSCPTLATPWTIAYQASLSMGFLRQEYWCGLPFPTPQYSLKFSFFFGLRSIICSPKTLVASTSKLLNQWCWEIFSFLFHWLHPIAVSPRMVSVHLFF